MALDVRMAKVSSSSSSSWVGLSISVAGVGLSLAVVVAASWLWHRSLRQVDLVARVEPGSDEPELSGVGSYKGAVLIGSIKDPPSMLSSPTYAHSVFLVNKGKGSFLHVEPEYKHGKFGFGVSRGMLRLSLPVPLLFWMKSPPPSQYRVVYVPYYFLMLLGMIHPARIGWRRWGAGLGAGGRAAGSANPSLHLQKADAVG